MYFSGYEDNIYRIECMRFELDYPLPDVVKTIPHVAFEVANLSEAIQGRKIIIQPNRPSDGVLVAFIEDKGAPVELKQFE
jgi:hypothetical protein